MRQLFLKASMNSIDNIKLNPNGLREGLLSASIEGFKIINFTQILTQLSDENNLVLNIEKLDKGIIKQALFFSVKGLEKDLFVFQKELSKAIQDYETRYDEKLTMLKQPGLNDTRLLNINSTHFKSFVDTHLSCDISAHMRTMAENLQLKITIESHKENLMGQKIHYSLSGLQTQITQFTENLNLYLEKQELYKKKKIK